MVPNLVNNILFLWSILSTIIGVILLCASLWQMFKAKNAAERSKAQVKIWMQDANGLQQSLTRIVQDNIDKRYHSTDDMANSIWALHANAFSLYQSLYEERSITEEEYVQQQKEFKEELKKRQALGNITSTMTPPKVTKNNTKSK